VDYAGSFHDKQQIRLARRHSYESWIFESAQENEPCGGLGIGRRRGEENGEQGNSRDHWPGK